MEWFIGAIFLYAIFKKFGNQTGSSGIKRAFGCDSCGSKKWILLDSSYYDDNSSYNYKEWLECAKCGNTITNEKTI